MLKFRRILQGTKWRYYRIAFLSEHKWCVECKAEGKLVAATNIDHAKPWRFYPDLFWYDKLHRPLCQTHHSRKTFAEDGAFGRERKKS